MTTKLKDAVKIGNQIRNGSNQHKESTKAILVVVDLTNGYVDVGPVI